MALPPSGRPQLHGQPFKGNREQQERQRYRRSFFIRIPFADRRQRMGSRTCRSQSRDRHFGFALRLSGARRCGPRSGQGTWHNTRPVGENRTTLLGLGMESAGSYHRGQVPYNGQTDQGSPYSTRTDEYIGDVSLRVGRWFDGRYPAMPYAGIGYRRWDRDIQAGSLNGLFESYRWSYLWLGLKQSLLPQQNSSLLFLDAGLLKPITPEIHIDFKGTYPVSPTVYPRSNLGLRFMLTSSMALSKDMRMTLEPYYEYWKLGRSPSVSTPVSTGILTVHEPASRTSNFGLNLRFGRLF